MRTLLCEFLGIGVPIIQAPIGSASCPSLAAAVSNAGGLGMLAASWLTLHELHAAIEGTRRSTARPIGINLVLAWPQDERLRLAIEDGIRIFSFAWGDPSTYSRKVHAAGGVVLHTAGGTAEAISAVRAGADVIVAQGWEAGGHVLGQVALSVLVPSVCDVVGPHPVVAAGGIADGRGLAAALALGAQGVWMGTRFLASAEADVHAEYQKQLLAANESDTVHATLFDGGWPDAPHRTLRNSVVQRWEEAGCPVRPNRPGEGETVAWRVNGQPIHRYEDTIPVRDTTGQVEALALYCGQSAGLIHKLLPAAEIVRRTVVDAEAALRRAAW